MASAEATCGSCRHYIGGGDWNLCCDLMYDLCYRHTKACDKYEFSEETIRKNEEQDRRLAEMFRRVKND